MEPDERDLLLDLGFNYFIACASPQSEEAMVFMGDSLFNAGGEFRSTLEYSSQACAAPLDQPWRLSRTADQYPDQTWEANVIDCYQDMYDMHQARLDGVHSFLVAAEGCINDADFVDGINFMCQNTIVDSYVQLGHVIQPFECHTLTTYEMASLLVDASHVMTGHYTLQYNPFTPYSGDEFQERIDVMVSALADGSRGIRDGSSPASFWAVLQTQEAPTDPDLSLRLPTAAEIQCSVNLSLAYGAKGIAYYRYATGGTESGLLDANRDPNSNGQYDNVQEINTDYQGTGESLVDIGANFMELTWQESFSMHDNLNEPVSATHDLHDVTARPPAGSLDAEDETYVEIGVLQNDSDENHYMVVNRRCDTNGTREITVALQAESGHKYRVTNLYNDDIIDYYPGDAAYFSHSEILGPGEGVLLRVQDLGETDLSGTLTYPTVAGFGTVDVTGDVTVPSELTLTVLAGSTLRFTAAGVDLWVKNGSQIIAEGTAGNAITFTSSAANPQRKSWGTIFVESDDNTFEYCIVEYSDWGLKIKDASYLTGNVVKNCTFRDNDQGLPRWILLT